MIRCENLTEQDLQRIGTQVAEAFLGEKGCFTVLTPDTAARMFTIIVRTCYEAGCLYTTGENQEGFCAYWTKDQRPGFGAQLKMACRMLRSLPLKAAVYAGSCQDHWQPTEKRYRKQKDFVEVFLIAVRKEYQGRGHFRRMLEEPFALAEKRGTICVLDTDSELKAAKYTHLGMHIVDRKPQRRGFEMFALEK